MAHSPDENAFRKGLAALSEGKPEEAAVMFEAAMKLGGARGSASRKMRYLSFFGLSSAMAHRPCADAIRACEVAARRDFLSAELQFNLGKVYLLAGKTTRALAAFERGLSIAPNNKALRAEMMRTDRRGSPPIPWLRRNHPLNRCLGRMRSTLGARAARRRTATP